MALADPSRSIVRRQVQSVEFGFYTDDDVRTRSVCEVTSPQSLDALGTPLPFGMYDARMGPTDMRSPPCVTCGCTFQDCPGHAGHVELCVPTYHPLLFARLLELLRCKCFNCHRLRWSQRQVEMAKTQFVLLEQGRIKEAQELESELAQALHAARSQRVDGETVKPVSELHMAATVDQFLRDKQKTTTTSSNTRTIETSVERQFKRNLVKHVLSSCRKARKCESCGAFSPPIRQDASNKIFQAPLAEANARINAAEGIIIQSALEEKDTEVNYESDDTRDNHDDEDMEVDGDAALQQQDDEDNDDSTPQNDKFMHALEVEAQVKRTWLLEPQLCHFLFGGGTEGYKTYFLRAIPVPPSRFRPPMVLGIMTVEHAQNHYLNKMLLANDRVRTLLSEPHEEGEQDTKAQNMAITTWIELQTIVNCYIDSSKDPSAAGAAGNAPSGIRQILEKKEGIFRKHMMGKRVDFACRSVISPDPYVGTNEIGIPLHFAKTLTYPTPVTARNSVEMRKLVERGKEIYPGASWVEFPNGRRVELGRMDAFKRQAVAARILAESKAGGPPVFVGRQLRNGDMMLVNRQPTLHKPGIMAHNVRVLHSPTQKTIRMHYANCNTYNADFDGDEMNCHFPQNDIARAESEFIAATDLQYIVPTDGSPLRGLIQDHVDSGVKLTCKDTFLEKWEYMQLLFATLGGLSGLEMIRSDMDITLVPPTIRKPRELWTGKQVITTLLNHLRRGNDRDGLGQREEGLPGISLERKAKTPETAFGGNQQEHLVLVRDGELLRGVLDKAAFGATDFSLVHAVYEAYGPSKAGLLLNAFGRLFTAYLQYYSGHSCRMEDLVLTREAEGARRNLVQRAYNTGSRAAKAWADSEGGKVQIQSVSDQPGSELPLKPYEAAAASAKIGQLLSGTEGTANFAALDGYMQSQLNPLASKIIKACLPNGLEVPFPANTFGLMVTTGAKGSTVNQSQVSCALGQQALEGRRVPRMSSGRTLPSFAPYDPSPRADGFIADRFLTGVRPQEYYFHCMAGREGLVDTAVKTSRSGYLQRCLVKHMEELKVCYDWTVRDGEGGVVQFLYGEDGLDPTKAAYLDCSSKSFEYVARNHEALKRRNTALPGATLDAAAFDADRAFAVSQNDPSLMSKGSFVHARRLRVGSRWVRGALCRGWFDAVITDVHTNGALYDLVYLDDKAPAKDVPLQVDLGQCGGKKTRAASSICTLIRPAVQDPILSDTVRDDGKYRLGMNGACVSEKVALSALDALTIDGVVKRAVSGAGLSRKDFSQLMAAKYGTSLCAPGEAVGSIAAQSVGEPSTQMTLNTFHLAGSGANVTLGIPRLREIIMTASKELKTPTMSVPLRRTVTDREALKLTRFFTRLTLMEVISSHGGIKVVESLVQGEAGNWERAYQVTLKLHPAERIKEAFGLSLLDIAKVVARLFIPKLSEVMKRELRRSATDGDVASIDVQGGAASDYIETTNAQEPNNSLDIEEESEDEGAGEEIDAEDGVMASRFGHKREMESYGDMDDEDKQVSKTSSEENENSDDGSDGGKDEAALITDDEGQGGRFEYDEAGNAVKVDMRRNSLILQPLRVDPSARPLLMVGLVERAATATLVRTRPRISQAFINEEEGGRGRCLQTAGVNFEEFWKLNNVKHNQLASNDIWAMRCAYGVEAARNNIVEQIRSVFGAYGISVDPRHLFLIADYMSFEGGFKAMNRTGMADVSSPFLQMSFETTALFMTEAALRERKEELISPSANIVLGRPIKHGTGAFELLAK